MRHGKKNDAHIANSDGRIPEEEELVEASHDDGENETDYPGANGVDGHAGVIRICYGRADLGVRRVILCNSNWSIGK